MCVCLLVGLFALFVWCGRLFAACLSVSLFAVCLSAGRLLVGSLVGLLVCGFVGLTWLTLWLVVCLAC